MGTAKIRTRSKTTRKGSLRGTFNGQYSVRDEEQQEGQEVGWTEEQLRAMTSKTTTTTSQHQSNFYLRILGSRMGRQGSLAKKRDDSESESEYEFDEEEDAAKYGYDVEEGQDYDEIEQAEEQVRPVTAKAATRNEPLTGTDTAAARTRTRKGSLQGTFTGQYSYDEWERRKKEEQEGEEQEDGWTKEELR